MYLEPCGLGFLYGFLRAVRLSPPVLRFRWSGNMQNAKRGSGGPAPARIFQLCGIYRLGDKAPIQQDAASFKAAISGIANAWGRCVTESDTRAVAPTDAP